MNKKAESKIDERGEKRFRILLNYWIRHNREHTSELEGWLQQLEEEGREDSAQELQKAVMSAVKMDQYLKSALEKISNRKSEAPICPPAAVEEIPADFDLKKIGTIHTPYRFFAPYQPREDDDGEFIIEVDPAYEAGLNRLDEFRYIYIIYFLHRHRGKISLETCPPWTDQIVGLFASRSSRRPNPIGLSVVRLESRQGNKLFVSGLDVFDGTPLLDLKPYLQELDSKADADYGWMSGGKDREHLLLHINGTPH